MMAQKKGSMPVLIAVGFVLSGCAGVSSSTDTTKRFHHPTLPVDIVVSTKTQGSDFRYTLDLVDRAKKEPILSDSGIMPPLNEHSLHADYNDYYFQQNFFPYDLNFDGHKEFFLADNNPAHYSDCAVYIFDEGNAYKQRLCFSEIILQPESKTFTCSISEGQDGRELITYQFNNGVFEIIQRVQEHDE